MLEYVPIFFSGRTSRERLRLLGDARRLLEQTACPLDLSAHEFVAIGHRRMLHTLGVATQNGWSEAAQASLKKVMQWHRLGFGRCSAAVEQP